MIILFGDVNTSKQTILWGLLVLCNLILLVFLYCYFMSFINFTLFKMGIVMSLTWANCSQCHLVQDEKGVSQLFLIHSLGILGRTMLSLVIALCTPETACQQRDPLPCCCPVTKVRAHWGIWVSGGEEYFEFRCQEVSFCASFLGEWWKILDPKHWVREVEFRLRPFLTTHLITISDLFMRHRCLSPQVQCPPWSYLANILSLSTRSRLNHKKWPMFDHFALQKWKSHRA